MGWRTGRGRGTPTLTEEDSVLEGEGRCALLAAEAAHGGDDQRHRRHRATNPHAAPADKRKAPRVRTQETGLRSRAGNGFKLTTHPARRRTPSDPARPAPLPSGPASADRLPSSPRPSAPRLGHVASGELWLWQCSFRLRPVCFRALTEDAESSSSRLAPARNGLATSPPPCTLGTHL